MFKINFQNKFALLLIASLPIIVIDRITKLLVHNFLHYHESITIIPNFFSLTYVRNLGAAWGFLSNLDASIRTPFFWIISIIAIIGIPVYLKLYVPQEKKLTIITLALIFGGAIGNFLDRTGIFHQGGFVIDFLDFYYPGGEVFGLKVNEWHWPAFNIADSSISIAIALVIYITIKDMIEEKKKKRVKG